MKQIKTSANWKEPPINSPGAHSGFKTLQYLLRGQEGGAKAVQKVSDNFKKVIALSCFQDLRRRETPLDLTLAGNKGLVRDEGMT